MELLNFEWEKLVGLIKGDEGATQLQALLGF